MSFRDHLIAFILRARQIRGQVDDLEAEIVKGETKGRSRAGFQGMKHKLEIERRKRVVFDGDSFLNIMKRFIGDLAYMSCSQRQLVHLRWIAAPCICL